MAETPPGWLKPDDLSKRGTARRAVQLLGDFLDEDQREQAERYGGFVLHSKDRVFWIPLDDTPWCAFADDGRVEHYCIAPDKRGGMPEGDVTLTYLLWIKYDCENFLREANVLSTKKIEWWPDSEAELVETLAELTRPPPARVRPRPRPHKVKKVAPRKPGLCLDAEQVRAIFDRHGKEVPEELLRKLRPG